MIGHFFVILNHRINYESNPDIKLCTKTNLSMKVARTLFLPLLAISILILSGCGPKYTIEEQDGISIIQNKGGQTLAYAPASGVTLIEKSGYAFKDLNKNGILDDYEDWRLSVDERISNLVGQMSVEQMAGLMLYSAHQSIPSGSRGFFGANTYDFAFGLNWSGVISDERVSKYK